MNVRAKFVVQSVTRYPHGTNEVRLTPVTDDGIEENRRFHKARPSGQITMSIDNPSAAEEFEPGDEFYVDFTPIVQNETGTAPAGAA